MNNITEIVNEINNNQALEFFKVNKLSDLNNIFYRNNVNYIFSQKYYSKEDCVENCFLNNFKDCCDITIENVYDKIVDNDIYFVEIEDYFLYYMV